MILCNHENNNNICNIVSNPKSKDEESKEEIEVTSKTTLNPKVARAMKNLHVLYNEDATRLWNKLSKKKKTKKKLSFLLILLLLPW